MKLSANLILFIKLLSKLPTIGPRNARRIALSLIKNKEDMMLPLIDVMTEIKSTIKICKICGNYDVTDICSICNDKLRRNDMLCVIEDISDLWAIEKSEAFNGKYHILGSKLSSIDNFMIDYEAIDKLVKRIIDFKIKEVIIATNFTIQGQNTAYYILDLLKDHNIKLTKLAHGMPFGSDFDYLDESTINIAFKSRKIFDNEE